MDRNTLGSVADVGEIRDSVSYVMLPRAFRKRERAVASPPFFTTGNLSLRLCGMLMANLWCDTSVCGVA